MNERLEKEVKQFHKMKLAIFPSEMPKTWQVTQIIATHFYNLALEDVKKEIKKKLSVIESKDIAGDSFANGVFDAYYEMLEFIDNQEEEK